MVLLIVLFDRMFSCLHVSFTSLFGLFPSVFLCIYMYISIFLCTYQYIDSTELQRQQEKAAFADLQQRFENELLDREVLEDSNHKLTNQSQELVHALEEVHILVM